MIKKNFPTFFLAWLLLLNSPAPTTAVQNRESIRIERVASENQLNSNSIQCIYQDSKGFIWIGGQGGLSRFDGRSFKSFHHMPDSPSSLSDNYVLSICEDREGVLWIGTLNGGLNRMDMRDFSIRHYRNAPGDPWSISSDYLNVVLEDRDGRLWIGANGGGLNLMLRQEERFLNRQNLAAAGIRLECHHIVSMMEDRRGYIWIGAVNQGLHRLNPSTGEVRHYKEQWRTDKPDGMPFPPGHLHKMEAERHGPPGETNAMLNDTVWSLHQDDNGVIWAGITGAILRYDETGDQFITYPVNIPNAPAVGCRLISSIASDNQGRLWLGAGNNNHIGLGVLVWDIKSASIVALPSLDNKPPLSPVSVKSLLRERGGTIWFAACADGLFKYNPDLSQISGLRYDYGNPNSLSGDKVWGICEDRDGYLWVGVLGGGLNRVDRKTMTFKHYRHDPSDPGSLRDDSVRNVLQTSDGFIWVGTDSGLDQLDPATERFSHYIHFASSASEPKNAPISYIYEDRNLHLWVSVWETGLFRFDRKKNELRPFYAAEGDPEGLKYSKITCILHDSRGSLWLGAYTKGLLKMESQQDGHFSPFPADPQNNAVFRKQTVHCILETQPDVFWLGTRNGGLYHLNPSTGMLINYYLPFGAGSNCIYGILSDSRGDLWMSTNNGIYKFQPKTGTFKGYSSGNRLLNDEFNQGSYFKNKTGEMFFGGINGVSYFNPENMVHNRHVPPIVITDIRIFGESILYGRESRRLYNDESDEISLRLNYRENHFSFEFAALDYAHPANNRYAYKMEGFDRDWIQTGARRFANYTNLDGGAYVFRVIGANNDGVWNEKGISIPIVIIPPFWATWWFRALIMFSLASAALLFFLNRTAILRRKLEQQEKNRRELQQSRDALKEAKDIIQLRHDEVLKIVSAISSILIVCDSHGGISQWNGPAEKCFGFSRDEAVGKNIRKLLARFFREDDLQSIFIAGATRNEPEIHSVSVNFGHKERLVDISINPIADSQNGEGKNPGFLLLMEDATDRLAEEARKNIMMKLKTIGQLQMGISHEVNTPLQYIRINNKILSNLLEHWRKLPQPTKPQRGKKPPENTVVLDAAAFEADLEKGVTAVRTIEEGLNATIRITRAMKEFFYPGTEKKEMADINELISSTLIVSGYKLRKSADIETSLSSRPALIPCYPARLNLVFLNLLTNAADAVEASGKHGKISITTDWDEYGIVIRVSDTGVGIPPEHEEKIFTPYFTTKGIGSGTGLGLSMARKIIVENHGGHIGFKSTPGQGAEFIIRLPFSATDPSFNEFNAR